jgi:CRISPR-associated endonuclease/helicase Cas3
VVVIDEDKPQPKKQEAPTADEQARIRIYQGVKHLFERLRNDSTIDVSPESLRQLSECAGNDDRLRQFVANASSPAPLRPALNRALLDAWSMTSLPEHTGRPEVAPWLRGWVNEDPQTTVAWRKYLPAREKPAVDKKEIENFIEAAPLHASETLETESYRVFGWLKKRAKKLIEAKQDEQILKKDDVVGILLKTDGNLLRVLKLSDLLGDTKNKDDKKRLDDIERDVKGKTLVLDARFGGLQDGLLKAEASHVPVTSDDDSQWLDPIEKKPVIRFRIFARDSESDVDGDDDWHESLRFALEHNADGEVTRWLSIQKWRDTSNNEDDRAEGRPQPLAEHQSWAEQRAQAIGERLGLPEHYITMLATAARLHDEGKRARRWQRAFHAERDARKFKIEGSLAKTRGPINQAVLGGYRHEFGSLPYAQKDSGFNQLPPELQDLVLHLIAAHHGYARPLIATAGCEDAPPSALEDRAREVALRFARLQKRWGPWGLAWWEALLRAADAQASWDNDKREKN